MICGNRVRLIALILLIQQNCYSPFNQSLIGVFAFLKRYISITLLDGVRIRSRHGLFTSSWLERRVYLLFFLKKVNPFM